MANVDPLTITAGAITLASTGTAWWYQYLYRRSRANAAALTHQLRIERHAAMHDPLTGLANRRAFDQIGTTLLSDPARLPLTLIMIDLDDFKRVNDTFGHVIGDQVLVIVARRLVSYAAGDLVGRLGGDEFAALLTNTPPTGQQLQPDPADLIRVLAKTIDLGESQIDVSASVGVATAWVPTPLAKVMRAADAAMYRAKPSHRRSHSIDPAFHVSRHAHPDPIPAGRD